MNVYDLDHPLADLGLPNHLLPDTPVEEDLADIVQELQEWVRSLTIEELQS